MEFDISKVKKGDRFYESDYGKSVECIALEDARRMHHDKGWGFRARNSYGEFDLYRADGWDHLSSELSHAPVYLTVLRLEDTSCPA